MASRSPTYDFNNFLDQQNKNVVEIKNLSKNNYTHL